MLSLRDHPRYALLAPSSMGVRLSSEPSKRASQHGLYNARNKR